MITVYAYHGYDENIIKLQAIAYPKIVFADQNISSKLVDDKIVITILYDEIDRSVAKKFRRYIQNEYTQLGAYGVEVRLQEYADYTTDDRLVSAYICLPTEGKTLEPIAQSLNREARVTFAYSVDNLDYGVLMGLEVRATIQLTINRETLQESTIVLDENLFRVVKFR